MTGVDITINTEYVFVAKVVRFGSKETANTGITDYDHTFFLIRITGIFFFCRFVVKCDD